MVIFSSLKLQMKQFRARSRMETNNHKVFVCSISLLDLLNVLCFNGTSFCHLVGKENRKESTVILVWMIFSKKGIVGSVLLEEKNVVTQSTDVPQVSGSKVICTWKA